ncbi:glycosyltransferase [Pyxidicoccus sp. MSG2]|uniref:glycosyltransferase n=1 Tax=Pyxidicoccus sp. MSG2 TaxID=2996790 RepID=UPI00226F191D|nr:glycosyltransferase [Pyxidicoccus sp. MSG2]MCY1024025.1 glycosyltransferase [Pyxidicoccus sp. MSG2]
MLELVDVGERSLESYRGIAPAHLLAELRKMASGLQGARVLHINATPYGGGVSELLRSEVPLLNDLGLIADWRIIRGEEAFFQVTKAIHNALQGAPRALSEAEQATYLVQAQANAREFMEEYDFVFVHDPQPVALLPLRGKGHTRWIWRCHIDTSHPQPDVWRFIRAFLPDYDAAIFTMAEFVPPDMPIGRLELIPPAIDPLSPKNLTLPRQALQQVLKWIGIRPDRPLVTQVSRFDPWKDPLGVLAAYRLVREEFPDLQLALVGSLALDDPEGWEVYRRIQAETRQDRLVHVFTNLVGVGNIEVNAFQALSDVVIQKSLREGFGLVVSEALWKGTPVVAGRTGGIPLQMADGVGGLLVDTVETCAAAVLSLLRGPEQARMLGERGRERVREHFLIPRLVLNHLTLMAALSAGRPIARPPGWELQRDLVCGMALGESPVEEMVGGVRYGFCSESCRSTFREDPGRYVRAR